MLILRKDVLIPYGLANGDFELYSLFAQVYLGFEFKYFGYEVPFLLLHRGGFVIYHFSDVIGYIYVYSSISLGQLFYRIVNLTSQLDEIHLIIRNSMNYHLNKSSLNAFAITWDKIRSRYSIINYYLKYQLILVTDQQNSFLIFHIERSDYFGETSFSDRDGNDLIFSSGLNLSNVNVEGRFVFLVNGNIGFA